MERSTTCHGTLHAACSAPRSCERRVAASRHNVAHQPLSQLCYPHLPSTLLPTTIAPRRSPCTAAAATVLAQTMPTPPVAWLFSLSTAYTAATVLLVRCVSPWQTTPPHNATTQHFHTHVQQMAILPPVRPVRRAVEQGIFILPLALAYATLLVHSWQPDTLQLLLPGSLAAGFSGGFNPQFFPSLQGIGQLFSRLITAASLWVHLLAINLFAARAVYIDGMRSVLVVGVSTQTCTNLSPTSQDSSVGC